MIYHLEVLLQLASAKPARDTSQSDPALKKLTVRFAGAMWSRRLVGCTLRGIYELYNLIKELCNGSQNKEVNLCYQIRINRNQFLKGSTIISF